MTSPPSRLDEEMHVLGSSVGRFAGEGTRVWVLFVLTPSFLFLLPLGLSGYGSPWFTLPAVLLAALYAPSRLLPGGRVQRLCLYLFLLLASPLSFFAAWRLDGRFPRLEDGPPLLLSPSAGVPDQLLSSLGASLPWDGAAVLDLRTGDVHADSSHARLAATTGMETLPEELLDRSKKWRWHWLATDGQGLVVLADTEGRVLAWRRPR